ncbi:MAG: RT0821/Lpp0805 family surface protein, partial [Pseudolabrys sp.]
MLAMACGGCSMSYQLDSFLGGERPESTASIKPPPGAKSVAQLPPSGDLIYARAAASELLKRGKKDASQPWENPESGARGTVTPIASAYSQGGQT